MSVLLVHNEVLSFPQPLVYTVETGRTNVSINIIVRYFFGLENKVPSLLLVLSFLLIKLFVFYSISILSTYINIPSSMFSGRMKCTVYCSSTVSFYFSPTFPCVRAFRVVSVSHPSFPVQRSKIMRVFSVISLESIQVKFKIKNFGPFVYEL